MPRNLADTTAEQATEPGFRVGLTGGIASGKSTIAHMFADLGVPIVDTDVIARELVEPGTPGLAELVARFGEDILDESRQLHRAKLRQRVFANPDERAALESILHPAIRAASLEQAGKVGGPYQILEVPLLIETGFDQLVQRILVVDCPDDLQIDRLIARDNINRSQARQMMAAQISRDQRLARADDVIDNGRGRQASRLQVTKLHSLYRDLAAKIR